MENEEQCEVIKTEFIVNPDGSITADEITVPPPPIPALTCEATKERLIITELCVRDFKSYAGDHVIGPFDKNFSCIVGPNGSGKSNVIDALLFVFGYRAQKIRSKKVSVLIHKSSRYPDLDSCSVSVNFATIKDQGRNFTVIPGSKFTVRRTGYKDNSSTYEINGKRAQYKDVASLLRSYGIDLDYNRFMILQGEIELISMMKPKAPTEQDTGMLEYIEDIIGSNRFIKPIQHFNSKVEETNEKRLEKVNQLKIIEKERDDAEKPRNKALEYLRLANEVALMKNSVIQAQIKVAQDEAEETEKKKSELAGKVKLLSDSLEELQACKEVKEGELKNISNDLKNFENVVEDLKKQFSELEREDVACRENIKNAKENFKKLVKSLDAEEDKVANLRKQPATLEKEIKELEEKKKKVEAAKLLEEEKLTEVMGTMKYEIQGFQEDKDSYESQLVPLKDVVNEKKSELDLAQSELDLILSSEKKEKEVLKSLQTESEKITSSIKEQKELLKEAEERLPQLVKELKSLRVKYTEEENKESNLTEELKIKRIKLDEAKNSLMSSQHRNALVQTFMDQKAKGSLTGVYGRLGDLGAIDAKYDIAISTACGSLDHIVTDTITTAQKSVDFLKANNLGYATFIALDKMKKWEPYTKQKIATPENVPRLFDLISVKDKDVLPAFYYALQDTLVANDLEQATRVGLQGKTRYRVVTLKGEVIDLSGTMSGGGGKVQKGRMGQTVADSGVSKKEVELLTTEVETLTKDVALAKKCKLELKENIDNAEKEISTLQHSTKKAKVNYEGYLEREKMLVSQIEEQSKKILSVAPDKKKIKELESRIEKNKQNYSKAVDTASQIEEKIKGLQEKIMSITKGKYGAVQKKVDKLAKEVDGVSQSIVKCTALLKKSDKNLKKSEEKVASLNSEIEALKITRENLKKEFEELEKRALEVSEKKNEAQRNLEQCENQKKQISRMAQDIASKIHQAKSELIELKNNLKMIEMDVKTNAGHVKSLNSQLSKLELYQMEGEVSELPTFTPEELSSVSINALNYEIGKIENQIKDMNPDLTAIAEFKRKEEMYNLKKKDLEDTLAEREHYRQHYEKLRKHRLEEFMKGFNIVTLKVKELYQMITLGGDAELELVDSLDPFSEGIEFSVRPLRKSWKNIRNLSGGEKTLSSLSLVFALHYYRSTPFFVMDEIDAALDYRNVSIIGAYIKECTKNAQFIVISLRENMFQLADHLVGIYKTNNRTKNVFLTPALLKILNDDDKNDVKDAENSKEKDSLNKVLPNKEKKSKFTKNEDELKNSIRRSKRHSNKTDVTFDCLLDKEGGNTHLNKIDLSSADVSSKIIDKKEILRKNSEENKENSTN